MIRWMFWDLGDTLLDEDPLRFALYDLLFSALRYADPSLSFAALLARREHLAAGGDPSPHYTIARESLAPEAFAAWVDDARRFISGEGQPLVVPVAGVAEALPRLARRVRMGVIADQPPEVEETLRRHDLRRWFDVVALDAVVGASKPDERIFRWALDRAGCSASEAVMVGNRLDRDIAPARRVGMRTIFCYLSPEAKGWTPDTPHARLYLHSLARIPNWPVEPDPTRPDETPDARVSSIAAIEDVLDAWGCEDIG